MVNRLVNESLSARRPAAAEQAELMQAGHSVKVAQIIEMLLTPNQPDAQ